MGEMLAQEHQQKKEHAIQSPVQVSEAVHWIWLKSTLEIAHFTILENACSYLLIDYVHSYRFYNWQREKVYKSLISPFFVAVVTSNYCIRVSHLYGQDQSHGRNTKRRTATVDMAQIPCSPIHTPNPCPYLTAKMLARLITPVRES